MVARRSPPNAFPQGNKLQLKFNEERAQQVVTAIESGAYIETAAAYAGVTRRTLYYWLTKGRDGEQPYDEFVARVDKALANAEMSNLEHIAKARPEQWQAAAWLLERRYPQKYGRRTRIEGNVNVTARPFLDYAKLTPQELETLVALLEKARPDPDDPALGDDGRAAADLIEQTAAEEDVVDGEWEAAGEIEAA